jgi:hypothetical protein
MAIVFFLNKLHEGVDPAEYEQWVRTVDYPVARALKTINSYVVAKTASTLDGKPSPYDYIERVEVTNIDDYRNELANAAGMDDFFNQWSARVGESVAVFGEEIE